jgi:hypothetical protein
MRNRHAKKVMLVRLVGVTAICTLFLLLKEKKRICAMIMKGRCTMDFLHAFALSDEELLHLVLDGEALLSEKQAHLEQCPICQQRLAEFHQLNNALVARFHRQFCPGSMQISLYCEDLLAADERIRIANHILDCPLCAIEVADTRNFIREAPIQPETALSPLASVRRIIGVLTRQEAQLALRDSEESSGPMDGWSRQYHTDSINLSLHLTLSSSGDHLLIGILSSTNSKKSPDIFEGASAELFEGSLIADIEQNLSSREATRRSQVDDLGNFDFTAVPIGEYVIVIHLLDQDVVFEHITL